MRHVITTATVLAVAGSLLAACSGADVEEPEPYVTDRRDQIREQYGSVFTGDEGTFNLFGGEDDGVNGTAPGGVAVNPFLWRASLETIDFMPLNQTDPFGGVIITDWYAPPESPDERFKLNVYILGTSLRADGIKVAVFRQTRSETGWVDAQVDPETATGIEDNILARARELRVASLGTAE